MHEKWVVSAKKADFNGIAAHFGIDPVVARVMTNRGLTRISDMEVYLHGGRESLHDPHLLKDVDLAAEIIAEKIRQGKKIRIIGDYDIDGIMSTFILIKALTRLGADADTVIPDRIKDGYGLNEHLVTQAHDDGIDTILTCDNGIAAYGQICLAKELGMTVVVTDHHEVPKDEEGSGEMIPPADAVINPKQRECHYPYPNLCGAAVAFKLVQVLYECGGIPVSEADEFIENAGFATVGDVMDLTGENRVLVKLALDMLHHTKNIGMRALILQKNLDMESIKCYHIGFVLGPCLNASGRLETARISLKLLLCEDPKEAAVMAAQVIELNESRKQMTEYAVKQAKAIIEEKGYAADRVMVVYLPDCHESLAGIVAGRIREAYYRPVFVVTKSEEGCKGSARSIEEYSMYEEMCKCADLFTKFGGHPMAAGFSLAEDDIPVMRDRLNALTTLTESDLTPKVVIDVPMPIDYVYPELVGQLELLEPFGKGNEKPVFADRNLVIKSLKILGREGRVIRMRLKAASGLEMDAIYFGDIENLHLQIEQKFGKMVADDTVRGDMRHGVALHFTYYPEIDTYYSTPRLQLKITGISA